MDDAATAGGQSSLDQPDDAATAGSADTSETPVTTAANRFSLDDVLPLIVGASAIGTGLSGQLPTGNALADFVLPALLGALLPLLARWSGSMAVTATATLAFLFSALQLPAVVLAGLALAAAIFFTDVARPPAQDQPDDAADNADDEVPAIARAVAGGLAVNAALRLPDAWFFGSASLLAAVALLPLIASAWRRLPAEHRRLGRRVVLGASLFIVVAGAGTAIAGLWARSPVEAAIDDAEAGIDALQDADQPLAASLLESAADGFGTAEDRLSGPLTWPARWVPVLAQHARAIETAAAQGEILSATAFRTVTTADVDQIRGNNGAIDLALVADVNDELSTANRVLRNSRQSLGAVRSPWLVAPLDDRLAEVDVELVDVLADIDLANHATSVLPSLLGAAGPRQYLVLFVQPAESREFGGFVGAYGLLLAEDGRMSLLESGSILDDFDKGGEAVFAEPTSFPEGYYDMLPMVFPQNLTAVPDLPTIARAARELAPQWRNDPDFSIDGVFTIDPFALAGMLELTGPITVPGRDQTFDHTNVADFLLRDQYLEFADASRDDRQDALRDLAGVAFTRLLNIEVPGPERLGAIFGPLARADRIAFTTFDEAENEFLRRILLDADLPNVGTAVEMIAAYHTTGVAGKLDAYLERHLTYDVVFDPATRTTNGVLQMELTNSAPPGAPTYVLGTDESSVGADDDLLELAENTLGVHLYTRAEVADIGSDGSFRRDDTLAAFSYTRHESQVDVPTGASVTVTWTLEGQLDGEGDRYDLLVMAQPTARPGSSTVVVRPAEGYSIVDPEPDPDGTVTIRSDLSEHQTISVTFAPT